MVTLYLPLVPWPRLIAMVVARAIIHPLCAIDLLRVAWRFRRRRWYQRPPFLPVASSDYVRWRMYTAYGSEQAVPPPRDLERYARWARDG